MKTTSLLALSLVSLLLSCEKPKEVDDGRPRIKAISIAGIPQQDIEFIPERYVINVQLPANAPEGGLKPTFKLTENTEFLAGINPDGTFANTCGHFVLKVANDKMTAIYRNITSYQINFSLAPGCPEVIENIPITYFRDSTNASWMRIYVPLKNPFSSFNVNGISLKNLSTSKEHSNILPPYLSQYNLNSCPSGIDNRVGIFFGSYSNGPLVPGAYEVSIYTNCGERQKKLIFPQPLVLKE